MKDWSSSYLTLCAHDRPACRYQYLTFRRHHWPACRDERPAAKVEIALAEDLCCGYVLAFRSRRGDTFKARHGVASPSAGATTCSLAPSAAPANMRPPPTHCRYGKVELGRPEDWMRHLLTQVADHRINRVDELLHWNCPHNVRKICFSREHPHNARDMCIHTHGAQR